MLIMKLLIRDSRYFRLCLLCVLFFISFAYFLYGSQYFNLERYHFDEGASAYGAELILNGSVPYRDFPALYTPGSYFILAAVFKIFGISIRVKRLFAIIILASTVCGIYHFISKLCPKAFAFLAFLLSLAWLKSYMVYNRPAQLAILFLIFCCFAFFRHIKTEKRGWLFITGILTGVTSLFRQDFGFYILISIFLVILLKQLNYYKKEKWQAKGGLVLKNGLYLFSGLFLVLLPFFLYFIANSAFREMLFDIVIAPVFIYPKVRSLPFPQFKKASIIFYLPLFIFLLTGIRLVAYNWKNRINNPIPWLFLFFLFLGLGLFNYTRVRTCHPQLLPTMIPVIILFILLLDDFFKKITSKNLYAWRISVLAVSFLISSVPLFYLINQDFTRLKSLFKKGTDAKLDVARADGFYDDSKFARAQLAAIKYIQSKTKTDEKIFVGNIRHDTVVNSDIMFYFLSQRHSATKHYILSPGFTDTIEVQEEIIDDLKKNNPRYIVLWSGSKGTNEPKENSRSSGVFLLDNFIRENYALEQKFSLYLILKRI